MGFVSLWYINKEGGFHQACPDVINQTIQDTKAFYKMNIQERLQEDPNIPLHKLDYFPFDTLEEWDQFVRGYTAPIGIKDGNFIFESGCGGGAFLGK